MNNSKKFLTEEQTAALISWITQGKQSGEINTLAAKFSDPFKVSRPQITYYRKKLGVVITEEKRKAAAEEAIQAGLENYLIRINKLKELAASIEEIIIKNPLADPRLIAQYRGILDDIAKELGERQTNINANMGGKTIVEVEFSND